MTTADSTSNPAHWPETALGNLERYAACLKALKTSSCFSLQPLRNALLASTLLPDGAEDRALPGGNLSADSGAKTRPGFGVQLNPGYTVITGIGMNSDKSQGSGDRVPRKRLSFLSADSFVRSALT